MKFSFRMFHFHLSLWFSPWGTLTMSRTGSKWLMSILKSQGLRKKIQKLHPRGIPEEGLWAPTLNRSGLECTFFLPESPHPLTVIPVWRWLRCFLPSVKPEMLEDFTNSSIRMLSVPPQKCPLNPSLPCRAWGWGGVEPGVWQGC